MNDPYAGIATPEDVDPYQGIAAPAGPPRKSQTLGLIQGGIRPANNINRILPKAMLGKPETSARRMVNDYVAKRIQGGEEPGMLGDIAGGMITSAPLMLLPGGAAAQGAAYGALNTSAESPAELATDVALGGVFGKVGEALVGAASKGIQAATRPQVQSLKAAGVKLTPGQIFGGKAAIREDKLMSRPVVGPKIAADRAGSVEGWNRAMIDETLAPLGVKLPAEIRTGHDAVAYAQKTISKAYDDVVPKLTVEVDDALFKGMREVADEARMLPDAAKQIVANAVKGSGFGNGVLSGKALQNARSEIGRLASSYSGSANAYEREAGRVLGWVRDHVDDAMIRQNPKAAPALKAANKAFSRQLIIDDAASRADDGVFSTGQAKQAARRFDNTRRKTATARGEGPMADLINAARDVLPSKTPNSFTADRLMEGKLIPMITGARERLGYSARGAAADLASRLPPEAAAFVRRFQKPVGLFGGMSPSVAKANQRRE